MTLDLLWTDICYLGVLFFICITVILGLRKKHIREALTSILRKPVGVSSFLVLSFFLIISVLDSIHMRTYIPGVEGSVSVLDNMMYPVGSTYEKSYSAPLAYYALNKEVKTVHGEVVQFFPVLNYPLKQSGGEKEYYLDLGAVIFDTLVLSFICFILSYLSIVLTKRLLGKPKPFRLSAPTWSALITLLVMGTVVGGIYWLSRFSHVMGTGQIGEDVLFYTVKSIRTGMVIGLLTTLFMMPLALFLGIAAGYFGGIVDDVVQFTYTTLSSIPGVLLITASVLSLQTYIANHPEQFTSVAQSSDARLLALCIILGVTSWTSLCRLLRAEALKLREIDYVLAARALGSNWFTIINKHLLPNVMHIVIMTIVLDFSFLVMAEAVLSYVGVGVSATTISWGNMINGARMELARDPIIWWPITAAFVLMFFLVLAVNLVADALRDAFDPHQVG